MKLRAVFALAAALGAAAAALSACSPGPGAAAANELRRGNGSEPDSIDPQLARMEAAMTILRDCYEGLVSMAPDGSPVPGAARKLGGVRRRASLHIQAASRRALVERRACGRGGFRRGLAPAREPRDRFAVRADAGTRPERHRHRRGPEARRIARRLGARRSDAGRRTGRALALLPRDALAPEHLPGTPADARCEAERIRPPGRRGDERRVHARRNGRSARTSWRSGTRSTGTTRKPGSTPCATCMSPIRRSSSRASAPATWT